uniref:Transmembrane protein 233 n=1 Tax=Neogobius melanostomus TaxID=47308 RepID=A0A8C6WSK2_9GOBI
FSHRDFFSNLGSAFLEAPPPQAPPPLRTYLWLSILVCFCPAFPVNLLGLVFSVMSRRSYEQGDFDGSKRLGRNALWMGVASVLIGIAIIATSLSVRFGTVRLKH